jgi:hypothetical protein
MIDKLGKMVSGGLGSAIDRLGYASIGSGLGLWINSATEKAHSVAIYILPNWPQDWTEWAAAGSTAGALTFALKNLVDMYIKFRNRGASNADNDTD